MIYTQSEIVDIIVEKCKDSELEKADVVIMLDEIFEQVKDKIF